MASASRLFIAMITAGLAVTISPARLHPNGFVDARQTNFQRYFAAGESIQSGLRGSTGGGQRIAHTVIERHAL